jgi:DNA-directed RNA polymerase specialized sigma24 family protein
MGGRGDSRYLAMTFPGREWCRAQILPRPSGPDCNFLSPFVLTQRCSMGRPEKIISWWDREVDRVGRPIREDVRSAAHEVLAEAGRRTEALVADRAQAADLMEDSVAQVSRYLDRIGAPKSSPKNGLLLLAFSRALRRLVAKSRRLQLAGGAVELSSLVVDHGWIRQANAQLELENIVRKLNERNGTVLALRCAGYNWEEVAQKFGTSVTRIRNGFWREVKDLRKKLRDNTEKQRYGGPCHPGGLVPSVGTSTNEVIERTVSGERTLGFRSAEGVQE